MTTWQNHFVSKKAKWQPWCVCVLVCVKWRERTMIDDRMKRLTTTSHGPYGSHGAKLNWPSVVVVFYYQQLILRICTPSM